MSSANYLTAAELVARWKNAVTIGTLSNWRSKGIGPAFTKFGKSVRYPLESIQAYEADATRGMPPTKGEGARA